MNKKCNLLFKQQWNNFLIPHTLVFLSTLKIREVFLPQIYYQSGVCDLVTGVHELVGKFLTTTWSFSSKTKWSLRTFFMKKKRVLEHEKYDIRWFFQISFLVKVTNVRPLYSPASMLYGLKRWGSVLHKFIQISLLVIVVFITISQPCSFLQLSHSWIACNRED